MTYETIVLILLAHFVGDFILQSHWMASNKSKNWQAMGSHVLVYSCCLSPFGLTFAVVNGIAHLATDSISSRITSLLWAKQEWHLFFVVIGADQLAHYAVLFYTYGKL